MGRHLVQHEEVYGVCPLSLRSQVWGGRANVAVSHAFGLFELGGISAVRVPDPEARSWLRRFVAD